MSCSPKKLHSSYKTLFNEIKLFLFKSALKFSYNNKYFKLVLSSISKLSIEYSGDKILGQYLKLECNELNNADYSQPDNFYLIWDILTDYNKHVVDWLKLHLQQVVNYIYVIGKAHKLKKITNDYLIDLFMLFDDPSIETYIPPCPNSFTNGIYKLCVSYSILKG